MKKLAVALSAYGLALFAGNAFAQTCSPTVATPVTAVTAAPVPGNSCQTTNSLSNTCFGNNSTNNKGVAIYQVQVGSSNNFTVSVKSTVFAPAIAFIGSPCSSNTSCVIDQSLAAAGTVSGTASGLTAGTYFLIVADYANDAPGCGAFTYSITGTLPVSLQKFSVQ